MSLNSIVPFFDIDGRDEARPTSRIVTRHPTYYLPGGDLFITVQRVLFRIHGYFLLRESSHFLRLLTSSPHDPPVTTGTSATRPLILTDIIPSNFGGLYPPPHIPSGSERNARNLVGMVGIW